MRDFDDSHYEKINLARSTELTKDTFTVEFLLWDCKVSFLCPACGELRQNDMNNCRGDNQREYEHRDYFYFYHRSCGSPVYRINLNWESNDEQT